MRLTTKYPKGTNKGNDQQLFPNEAWLRHVAIATNEGQRTCCRTSKDASYENYTKLRTSLPQAPDKHKNEPEYRYLQAKWGKDINNSD